MRISLGVINALFLAMLSAFSASSAVQCLGAFASAQVRAVNEPDLTKLSVDELDRRLDAALAKRDFDAAEPLLRRVIELRPREFVPLYNLACVRSAKGDTAEAGELLVRAVENGFDDYRKLTRDADLAAVRDAHNGAGDANYRKLVDNWATVLNARRDANLNQIRRIFDKVDADSRVEYTEHVDEKRRFIYRTAYTASEFQKARAELDAIADWAEKAVFPGLWNPDEVKLDPWVIIVLPSSRDFEKWLLVTFGPGVRSGLATVGGSYVHERKQLVSQDLGSTLRHEFFHALHWRHLTHTGVEQPYWVQEGLASLVEDVEPLTPGSAVKPLPSWRTNIVLRRERSGTLLPLERFAKQSREKFLSGQQLANYAHARAIFYYLHQQNKLGAWYAAASDPKSPPDAACLRPFETVFGKPLREVDKDFRAWARKLPEVAEEIRAGMASLGVEVESGRGDGLVITSIVEPAGAKERSLLGRSTLRGVRGELKTGDVITAIDQKPTRDIADLVRVLGEYKPDDEVSVSYLRKGAPGEARIRLVVRQ
ncbi:MAG TPA: PDZ domain-containing protein [Phycisphaerales bacterium]